MATPEELKKNEEDLKKDLGNFCKMMSDMATTRLEQTNEIEEYEDGSDDEEEYEAEMDEAHVLARDCEHDMATVREFVKSSIHFRNDTSRRVIFSLIERITYDDFVEELSNGW
jgi:hypothetical protein